MPSHIKKWKIERKAFSAGSYKPPVVSYDLRFCLRLIKGYPRLKSLMC